MILGFYSILSYKISTQIHSQVHMHGKVTFQISVFLKVFFLGTTYSLTSFQLSHQFASHFFSFEIGLNLDPIVNLNLVELEFNSKFNSLKVHATSSFNILIHMQLNFYTINQFFSSIDQLITTNSVQQCRAQVQCCIM